MLEQFFCKQQQCTFKFLGTVVFRVINDAGGVVTTETVDLKPAKDSKETPPAKLHKIRLSHCVIICELPVLSCSLYVTCTCCWNLRACVVRQAWTPREGLAGSGSPLFHHQLVETQALRAPSKTYVPYRKGKQITCISGLISNFPRS